MEFTRRKMLASSGVVALATTIGARLPGAAFAQEGADGFDIDAAFAAFMQDLGQEAGDGGGAVTFTG
jgi:hypothetical protein